MGVDPNVEKMEIQDWLLRIDEYTKTLNDETEFPFWRKLLYKIIMGKFRTNVKPIEERRTYRFVYTKVFPYGILHDYSYWSDFVKHMSVRDWRAIDVATDAMYIGRKYVKIESLSIANEQRMAMKGE
ncbi:MAG TPA: hypothetical protein VFR94_24180 [Nitrososphaeraceae archaeon]|nr:hypothetical protein [Nitrososphaeraceae archaeon]